jgi:hypothetical protein
MTPPPSGQLHSSLSSLLDPDPPLLLRASVTEHLKVQALGETAKFGILALSLS